MSFVSRASLPSNFVDMTSMVSQKIMLRQPEPMYLFAKMAMAGRLKAAAIDAGADNVQQYLSMSGNGASVPQELARLATIADEALPDAVMFVQDLGKVAGDTMKMDRDLYEGGGYSLDQRKVIPGAKTSVGGQAIRAEQAVITLQQFEGPWGTQDGEVVPYRILNFDARYRANKGKLADQISRHMNRDFMKWMDIAVRDLFRATSFITFPAGISQASDFVAGGAKYVTLKQLAQAKEAIASREVRPFSNGLYFCVVPNNLTTQLIDDSIWRELSRQTRDQNPLFDYVTRYEDMEIVRCTTLKTYVTGDTINGSVVGAGVILNEALILAPEAVGMGAAGDPEPFFADDTNYGKEAKVIWRFVGGFQTLDSRFVQKIIYQVA